MKIQNKLNTIEKKICKKKNNKWELNVNKENKTLICIKENNEEEVNNEKESHLKELKLTRENEYLKKKLKEQEKVLSDLKVKIIQKYIEKN